MKTASSFSISCSVVIYDVRPTFICPIAFILLTKAYSCIVHLERLGSLSEDAVRFYVAEIASALTFLHEKRIIHRYVRRHFGPTYALSLALFERRLLTCVALCRDLKPDNILLDEKGHAHITDLNIAVHYSERRMLTGVAGSMAYMGT
jgi:serine/threonine kinase 32